MNRSKWAKGLAGIALVMAFVFGSSAGATAATSYDWTKTPPASVSQCKRINFGTKSDCRVATVRNNIMQVVNAYSARGVSNAQRKAAASQLAWSVLGSAHYTSSNGIARAGSAVTKSYIDQGVTAATLRNGGPSAAGLTCIANVLINYTAHQNTSSTAVDNVLKITSAMPKLVSKPIPGASGYLQILKASKATIKAIAHLQHTRAASTAMVSCAVR